MGTISDLANRQHKVLGKDYCSGYTDVFGKWNTGFYCPQLEPPNVVYCCGTVFFKYCCTMTSSNQPLNSSHTPSPFFLRTPVLLGILFGALGISICVAVLLCFLCSCCFAYKKRRDDIQDPGHYQTSGASDFPTVLYNLSQGSNGRGRQSEGTGGSMMVWSSSSSSNFSSPSTFNSSLSSSESYPQNFPRLHDTNSLLPLYSRNSYCPTTRSSVMNVDPAVNLVTSLINAMSSGAPFSGRSRGNSNCRGNIGSNHVNNNVENFGPPTNPCSLNDPLSYQTAPPPYSVAVASSDSMYSSSSSRTSASSVASHTQPLASSGIRGHSSSRSGGNFSSNRQSSSRTSNPNDNHSSHPNSHLTTSAAALLLNSLCNPGNPNATRSSANSSSSRRINQGNYMAYLAAINEFLSPYINVNTGNSRSTGPSGSTSGQRNNRRSSSTETNGLFQLTDTNGNLNGSENINCLAGNNAGDRSVRNNSDTRASSRENNNNIVNPPSPPELSGNSTSFSNDEVNLTSNVIRANPQGVETQTQGAPILSSSSVSNHPISNNNVEEMTPSSVTTHEPRMGSLDRTSYGETCDSKLSPLPIILDSTTPSSATTSE